MNTSSSSKYPQGLLCVLEGIDGCGKSSLLQNIAQTLQANYPLVTTKEPGGKTELGKHLRTLIQEQPTPIIPTSQFLLFAADRAQHFTEFIIPHLQKNFIVLSDRMADSSLVYQGYGKDLPIDTLRMINQWAMQNIQPDIVFYIKIDPEIALQRMHKRNEGFSPFEQKSVLPIIQKIAHGYDEIFYNQKHVIILDGTQSLDELTKICVEKIIQAYQAKIS